jgi:hypothetical protein
MSTPQELRETAREYRQTAEAIYQSEKREHYHEALNHLYEATRRELYASMLEGKESEMERCIQLSKPKHYSPKEGRTHRDVRGRYIFTSTPYAQRKEEAEIQRHRHRERVKQKEESESVREGFKALPSQFTFKL